jgi:hypothetical protein
MRGHAHSRSKPKVEKPGEMLALMGYFLMIIGIRLSAGESMRIRRSVVVEFLKRYHNITSKFYAVRE